MQPTRKRGLIYKLDFSFRLVQNLSCPKKHKKIGSEIRDPKF